MTNDQLSALIKAKMSEHPFSYIAVYGDLIELDGDFTIEDLKEIVRIYEENRPSV